MGGSEDNGVHILEGKISLHQLHMVLFLGRLSIAGSNDFGKCKSMKSDRSRCIWSVREEEILMATLKELAAHGWKFDNRFQVGYLTHIKEAIRREFPKTGICPHPHIYSKITTWKMNYGSLMMMLNHSGIGFNSDGNYKIECDDESWAQFVKVCDNLVYSTIISLNLTLSY